MPDEQLSKKHHTMPVWLAFVIGVLVTVAGFTAYATITRQLPVRPTPSEPSQVATPESPTLSTSTSLSSPSVEPQTEPQKTAFNLAVNWNPEPIKVELAELGWTLPYILQDNKLEDLFTVYHVGTLGGSSIFGGSRLLLVERWCGGPCGVLHYRVIEKQHPYGRRSEFFILKDLSNVMEPGDDGIFQDIYSYDKKYDIPDLHIPVTLSAYHPDLDRGFTFEAEQFSPAALFKDFVSDRPLQKELTHSNYGILYEDVEQGYFIAKLPDNTVKLYRPVFPFETARPRQERTVMEHLPVQLTLQFIDGETIEIEYQLYEFRLCPPFPYKVYRDIGDRLKEAGTIRSTISTPFFVPKDPEDPIYREVYETPLYGLSERISYDEFLAKHPVILWKDGLGRWIRFVNNEFQPLAETECAYFNSVL